MRALYKPPCSQLAHVVLPSNASDLATTIAGSSSVYDNKIIYVHALLSKREVKMAGYWPISFFFFLRFYAQRRSRGS